jgi:hypothetical protein
MSSKSNMEKARQYERWLWITCGSVMLILSYVTLNVLPSGERGNGLVSTSLIFVAMMAGYTYGVIRALKREIADLKSGDSDTASVTASTDPPTPEGD